MPSNPDPFRDTVLKFLEPVQVVHEHYTDTDIPVRLGTAEAIWQEVRTRRGVSPVCAGEQRDALRRAGFHWVVIQGQTMYLYQRRNPE